MSKLKFDPGLNAGNEQLTLNIKLRIQLVVFLILLLT